MPKPKDVRQKFIKFDFYRYITTYIETVQLMFDIIYRPILILLIFQTMYLVYNLTVFIRILIDNYTLA